MTHRLPISLLVAALGLATPGEAAPSLEDTFRTSDVAMRLKALGHEVGLILPLKNKELMVEDYVPFQGALSDWDDEARLVHFRHDGGAAFTRLQFVSKAGQSIPGRLAALTTVTLDGDGVEEVLAIGRPYGRRQLVLSQIYRRDALGASYSPIWLRKDLGAACKQDGDTLLYYFMPAADAPFREERHEWYQGRLVLGAFKELGPTPTRR